MQNRKKIEEIKEVMFKVCTEWECNFIKSISEQVDKGRIPSQKQQAILDKIYQKVCDSPH